MLQFPFIPEPQEGPLFLIPLLLLTCPSPPKIASTDLNYPKQCPKQSIYKAYCVRLPVPINKVWECREEIWVGDRVFNGVSP